MNSENATGGGVETTWRAQPEEFQSLTKYLLYRRHLFAYEQAGRLGPAGGLAADIGCGFGYALRALGAAGRTIVAVDMASSALARLGNDPQVVKVQGSATALPFHTGALSLLVSFQVIEHLPRDRAVAMLREVRRVLAPAGRAFVTTPNARWRVFPGVPPWNPFHAVEYGPGGIARLCDSAGIPRDRIRGVVGLEGAHEREIARVMPDRLALGSGRLARVLRRLLSPTRGKGEEALLPEHEKRTWFTLTEDYERGLDFWIEVEP